MGQAADVEAHAAVKLEGIAASGRLGVAEHHAQLLAQLIDEDAACARLGDGGGEFPQGLAHQAGLQSHLALAHLALDFGFWSQSGDTVDDNDVDGGRADELVGNFQRLLAVVGLADPQIACVHTHGLGIGAVEGVLSVDIGCNAAHLLRLGDGMQRQRSLARRLRAVDFDNASAGIATHTQRPVQTDGTRGDDVHILDTLVIHAHDGTGAKSLLNLGHSILHHLQLHGVDLDGARRVGRGLGDVVAHNVGRGNAQYLLPVNHHFLFQNLLSHSSSSFLLLVLFDDAKYGQRSAKTWHYFDKEL